MNQLLLNRKLTFLYTNIGRGHPFYLDGIAEELIRAGNIKLVRKETDVFEITSGVSKLGWKTIRGLYKRGSQEGLISYLYTQLRKNNDYNGESFLRKILGRPIKRYLQEGDDAVIVAHPLLASILRGSVELYYQHGEMITPEEAVVKGINTIFVPTDSAGKRFIETGYDKDKVIITGLSIEPALVRQASDCFEMRMNRITGQGPLCGAFFSSGAEPKQHIHNLVRSALSAVKYGHKILVFARQDGALASLIVDTFEENNLDFSIIDATELIPHDIPQASLVLFNSRREENSLSAKLFSEFDFLVSPAHERTNWAMGLGLPTFILAPEIGPFAPLNANLMLDAKVANRLDNKKVELFGKQLNELRQNSGLYEIAKNGWGNFNINGFKTIAEYLDSKISF